MSTTIPVNHVEMYRDNVIMLAQQKGSRLMRTVRNDGDLIGKSCYYDRLGATAATKITSRHADTPLTDSQHSRRRADLVDYDWADLIDNIDRIRTIWSPDSRYAMAGAWAVGRSMDDVIIEAANGNAYSGVAGATTVALPSAQKIAAGGTGLTLAKLLEAREKLDAADTDPDLPRYCIVKAKQVTDLLNTTEVKSSDYNTVKALAQGSIQSFMGFEFVRTQRLTLDGASATLVLAFTSQAIGMSMGDGLKVVINIRPDKRNSTQVYVSASIAATRIEEEQLVQIACV